MSAAYPTPAGIAPPPVAVPTAADQPPVDQYGPNNEDLPEELQKELVDLAEELDNNCRQQNLERVKAALEARFHWRGIHYIWWSESQKRFMVAGKDKLPPGLQAPRFRHCTNIYRQYGLAFIAIASDGKIEVRFWPENPEQPEDLDTAEAATDVQRLIERNNEPDLMRMKELYLMYLDGFVAYYIRYEADGEAYGYEQKDVLGEEPVSLGQQQLVCPECGTGSAPEPGGAPYQPCPGCNYPLDRTADMDVPPMVNAPVVAGQQQFPKGKEVITLHNALEVLVPPGCREQKEFSHLTYSTEIHKAKACATFPKLEDEIEKLSSGEGQKTDSYPGNIGEDDTWERRARLVARNRNSDADTERYGGLLTFKRTWIRPWAFYAMDSKTDEAKGKRQQLMALFPNGVYVGRFGKLYAESRNEALDDYWDIALALPSDGLDADAVGTDEISIQKRHTIIENIEIDTYERGVPMIFARTDTVNRQALKDNQGAGNIIPVTPRANFQVGQDFHETEPAKVSPQAIAHRQFLWGEASQHAVGTYPPAYGGDLGGNDTARGISIQTAQAKGRLGIFYRSIRAARCRVAVKAVTCFKRHRLDDAILAQLDPASQEFKAKTIKLDKLQGNVVAYPEGDENFPTTWAEKMARVEAIVSNPALAQAASTPESLAALQRLWGLPELKFQGMDARKKQMREIDKLLEDGQMGMGPIMQPPQLDPATGQPALMPDGFPSQPQMLPSVQTDQLDNDEAEYAACQEWHESDAGQLAKMENPRGYMNVELHAQMHMTNIQKKQAAAAMQQMAAPPKGGPPNGQADGQAV